MPERFLDFLDRLFGLPYWQLALLALIVAGMAVGGYFALRPPSRPAVELVSAEESAVSAERQGMTVYVAGAVANPGVVLLAQGDRVIDAIEAAGGPLPEADLEDLNLAQPVQDGQKIEVPALGSPGNSPQNGGGESEKVNLNNADRELLERLPGIGPTLAERIIAYREKNGGFRSVDELEKVAGIGKKKLEEIRDLVEI